MNVTLKIFITAGFPILGVLFLAFLNPDFKNNTSNLERELIKAISFHEIEYVENKSGWKKIIGRSEEQRLLLSGIFPNQLFSINRDFKFIDTINLSIRKSLVDSIKNIFAFQIDSPNVYLFCGNLSSVVMFSSDGEYLKTHKIKSTFSRAIAIENSILIRLYDRTTKGQLFVDYIPYQKKLFECDQPFNTQEDGGIFSDGVFHFDETSKKIVYIPHNISSAILFDRHCNTAVAMELLGDTEEKADVVTLHIQNKKIITSSKPVRRLHGPSFVEKGLLYIVSYLSSSDPSHKFSHKNTVIDIYNISEMKYRGSIFVPISKSKISSIYVDHDFLYLLTSENLTKTPITPNIIN